MPKKSEAEHTIAVAISRRAKTAREIAKETKLSKPWVHTILKRLRKSGFPFATSIVREGVTGPESKAFRIFKRQ